MTYFKKAMEYLAVFTFALILLIAIDIGAFKTLDCPPPIKYPYMKDGCVFQESQGNVIRTCG